MIASLWIKFNHVILKPIRSIGLVVIVRLELPFVVGTKDLGMQD